MNVRCNDLHVDKSRDDDRIDLVFPYLGLQVVQVKMRPFRSEQNRIAWNGFHLRCAELGGQLVFEISADYSLLAQPQCQHSVELFSPRIGGVLPAHHNLARFTRR